jgi:hypothetical protein
MTRGGESSRVEIMPRLQDPEKCIRIRLFRTLAAALNATHIPDEVGLVLASRSDTTPSEVVVQIAPL